MFLLRLRAGQPPPTSTPSESQPPPPASRGRTEAKMWVKGRVSPGANRVSCSARRDRHDCLPHPKARRVCRRGSACAESSRIARRATQSRSLRADRAQLASQVCSLPGHLTLAALDLLRSAYVATHAPRLHRGGSGAATRRRLGIPALARWCVCGGHPCA